MAKDLINLDITLEDEDYEILKKKAEEIGIDVKNYLINNFANEYLTKDAQADTFDNRVGRALMEAYKKISD
jgi:hypothetical protein